MSQMDFRELLERSLLHCSTIFLEYLLHLTSSLWLSLNLDLTRLGELQHRSTFIYRSTTTPLHCSTFIYRSTAARVCIGTEIALFKKAGE